MQILSSRTQAGPGRTVKQEQEQISPNHVQRLNLISVHLTPVLPFSYHFLGDLGNMRDLAIDSLIPANAGPTISHNSLKTRGQRSSYSTTSTTAISLLFALKTVARGCVNLAPHFPNGLARIYSSDRPTMPTKSMLSKPRGRLGRIKITCPSFAIGSE